MTRPRDWNKLIFWALTLVIAGVYFTVSLLSDFEYDNFIFDAVYRRHNGGSEGFSWQAMAGYIAEIRATDNWRLANILAPVTSLMLPRWLFALGTGASVAAITAVASVLATGGAPRWRWLAASWLMMLLFLPWRDRVFTGDYTLNYIYPGAVAMLLLYAALKGRLGWTLLLGALLGALHEGFALPLGAGFAVWILARRFRAPRAVWGAAAVTTAVALVFLLCPGMLNRLDHYVAGGGNIRFPIQIAVSNILTFALAGCWLWAAAKRIFGRRATLAAYTADPLTVVASVAALCGMALSFLIRSGDRAAFAPEMFAATALMRLRYLRGARWSTVKADAAAIVALLATCASSYATIVWQARLHRQFQAVFTQIKERPGTTVYHDIIPPHDIPPVTLLAPSRNTFVEPFTYAALYADPRYRATAVVPAALNAPLDTTLPSGTPRANLRGGAFYVPERFFNGPALTAHNGYDPSYRVGSTHLPVVTLPGDTAERAVFFIHFTGADSRGYYYLRPLGKQPAREILLPDCARH